MAHFAFQSRIAFLECTRCGEKLDASEPRTLCPRDAGALYARYDLAGIKESFRRAGFTRENLAGRPASMWRYGEVLPNVPPVTLGEGWTPLLESKRNPNVYIKDEGLNPTGSFKARGLSAAVTMAKAYGIKKVAIPSAGNAASALAAYAARAGIEAHIFMPRDVPQANLVECESYGAHVTLVNGLIGDCAKLIAERKQTEGWFDISTLKEPYRVEGKKTMGYEVAEQLRWELPDAIIYPTGGGVGLIGMWKAFNEMEALGWVGNKRPRMIAVQSTGCAPIPKAFDEGEKTAAPWPEASTIAAGLRVPKAYGDYLILDILRASKGTAIAVSDDEILDCVLDWARDEGVFAAPEGAASLAAYRKLLTSGFLSEKDTVVLFNTGSGLKYIDVIAAGLRRRSKLTSALPAARRIGGIIGPYG
jgi:threonine synthase